MERKMRKVQVRGGFSDRNGIDPLNTTMQLTDFDEITRIKLINFLYESLNIIKSCDIKMKWNSNFMAELYHYLASEVFVVETSLYDFVGSFCDKAYREIDDYIHHVILNESYDQVLTLLEAIFNWTSTNSKEYNFSTQTYETSGEYSQHIYDEKKEINRLFQQEYVGYRFIGDTIVPISDEMEVQAIQESSIIEFEGVRAHIQKAVTFLSDREKPDYANCVKESISAVESICQIISKNEKATLGQAIKDLESKGVSLHPALKNAVSSLYGYSSDEKGIRHANGMFENDVTFEKAKFMLVSCCAFVNYLIAEYGKVK